ncbi:hypothetical protein CFOL_v3_16138, partial [Cephalotus follicularis]
MHRSSSWNRVGDDYYSSPKAASGLRMSASMEGGELPLYDPAMEMAKKERSRTKFAENAVHIIPFVLLLCAFILWFFSNPDVDVSNIRSGDSIAARIEGLTIEGDIDTDSDGTQTGFLPVDVEDLDTPNKQSKDHKASRKSLYRF